MASPSTGSSPNFVIQGGSPHANEYAGDGPYTRDEISHQAHWRGTVGLSTRGRDTGDAQIFINLTDNVRLDFNYTIYGEVVEGDGDRRRGTGGRRDRTGGGDRPMITVMGRSSTITAMTLGSGRGAYRRYVGRATAGRAAVRRFR